MAVESLLALLQKQLLLFLQLLNFLHTLQHVLMDSVHFLQLPVIGNRNLQRREISHLNLGNSGSGTVRLKILLSRARP